MAITLDGTAGIYGMPAIYENALTSATAATGAINYDVLTQSVLQYTTNAAGNWTLNFRGNGSTTLGSLFSTGQSITVVFLVTQGATAYYNTAITIDGVAVTPKWQAGTAPVAGNANSVDLYTYAIIKTGSSTYNVFASLTRYA